MDTVLAVVAEIVARMGGDERDALGGLADGKHGERREREAQPCLKLGLVEVSDYHPTKAQVNGLQKHTLK